MCLVICCSFGLGGGLVFDGNDGNVLVYDWY